VSETIDLVSIPVPGADDLMCAEFDGHRWAALKPMCDSLGINYATQLQKLRRRSWATIALRGTVAADGRRRDMVMIDSRTIPMWLATTDENRVSHEAKPKLIAYQREASDALDAYFNHRSVVAPAVNQLDVLRAALDQIEAAQREATEAKAIAERAEARLDGIEGRHDWFCALGYSKLNGLPTGRQHVAQLGRRAAKIARTQGIQPEKVQHDHYGTVNQFPGWIWDQATGNGETDE
jgi:P22_AR N-terminal domain